MPVLSAMLEDGPVICAEGYLFECERRGYLQAGAFVPEVVLDHPGVAEELHREFVHAGSDVVEAFTYYGHRQKLRVIGKEDLLVASAILSSLPWDLPTARNNFERIRIQLEYHGILPEDRIIVAASLADLVQEWWDPVIAKIDEIQKARPTLNSLLVAALARSPYPHAEALARFDAPLAGMGPKGYKDVSQLQAALAAYPAAGRGALTGVAGPRPA